VAKVQIELPPLKLCNYCRRGLPLTCFAADRSKLDGHSIKCRECQAAYHALYYAKNKDKICERTSRYRRANPDVQRKAKRKWEKKNKSAHLAARRDWHRRKFAEDVEYRLNFAIRGALRRTMGAAKRNRLEISSTSLPYTAGMLKSRIEMNFKPGMSWNNYGEWHIDHRVPVARLIRRGVKSSAMINCLGNLVPLWAEENHRKGKR
jgi:hypothetical protein